MKQKLLSMIKESCLSNKIDQLSGLMKESIRIKTHFAEESLFEPWDSKIGGIPSLPEGIEWPQVKGRSMSFIGQFNMSEFPGLTDDSQLPQKGMLYFFYDVFRDTNLNSNKDLESWRVIFYDGDLTLLKISSVPTDSTNIRQFRCCKVELINEITMPQADTVYFEVENYQKSNFTRWEADVPGRIKLNNAEQAAYEEILQYLDDFYSRQFNLNRMFGYPDGEDWGTQSLCSYMMNRRPVRRGSEYEKEVAEWELLFQIDSDKNAGMSWIDEGRLFFWIQKSALREKNFDNICLAVMCV
jgi:uncharacterized protein YwqG